MSPRPYRRLDVIQLANPCSESWAEMKGDAQVRFCGVCEKNVYDLSAMTRVEAERRLNLPEGPGCIRFYTRADGTVATIDCAPIRFAAARALAWRTMRGAAAMLVSVLTLILGLGLFRLSGADTWSWLDGTVIARIAKVAKPSIAQTPLASMSDAPYPASDHRMDQATYKDEFYAVDPSPEVGPPQLDPRARRAVPPARDGYRYSLGY